MKLGEMRTSKQRSSSLSSNGLDLESNGRKNKFGLLIKTGSADNDVYPSYNLPESKSVNFGLLQTATGRPSRSDTALNTPVQIKLPPIPNYDPPEIYNQIVFIRKIAK
jgi:hypothetical protein